VGSRALLDAMVKRKIPSPHQESNPRTSIVQHVASHYTEYTLGEDVKAINKDKEALSETSKEVSLRGESREDNVSSRNGG
jgi:hypothetical protein